MGILLSPVLARLDMADYYAQPMLAHWCPACGELHPFACEQAQHNGKLWTWDGSVNFPTFSPAMDIRIQAFGDNRPAWICHYFLRKGVIEFLGDCTHELAGQKRGLIPIPEHRAQRIRNNEAARGGRKAGKPYGT
jgi:hypothetical protein